MGVESLANTEHNALQRMPRPQGQRFETHYKDLTLIAFFGLPDFLPDQWLLPKRTH